MSAPISAQSRDEEIQSKIRKIQAFGRNARPLCTFLSVLLLAIWVILVLFVLFGRRNPEAGDGGAYSLMTSALTPMTLKVWVTIIVGINIGIWLGALHQLRRLFGNLSAGAIYTARNVHCVRNVGLLWLLAAALHIVLPTTLVIAHRLMDASVPLDADQWFPSFSEMLVAFLAAGVVLLVSWVMDVGLHTKEHADSLERDAWLTI